MRLACRPHNIHHARGRMLDRDKGSERAEGKRSSSPSPCAHTCVWGEEEAARVGRERALSLALQWKKIPLRETQGERERERDNSSPSFF